MQTRQSADLIVNSQVMLWKEHTKQEDTSGDLTLALRLAKEEERLMKAQQKRQERKKRQEREKRQERKQISQDATIARGLQASYDRESTMKPITYYSRNTTHPQCIYYS